MTGGTAVVRQRLVERYGSPQEAARALREAVEQGVISHAERDLLLLALADRHATAR